MAKNTLLLVSKKNHWNTSRLIHATSLLSFLTRVENRYPFTFSLYKTTRQESTTDPRHSVHWGPNTVHRAWEPLVWKAQPFLFWHYLLAVNFILSMSWVELSWVELSWVEWTTNINKFSNPPHHPTHQTLYACTLLPICSTHKMHLWKNLGHHFLHVHPKRNNHSHQMLPKQLLLDVSVGLLGPGTSVKKKVKCCPII